MLSSFLPLVVKQARGDAWNTWTLRGNVRANTNKNAIMYNKVTTNSSLRVADALSVPVGILH